MKLNILVVSEVKQRENAFAKWLIDGYELLNRKRLIFDLQGIYTSRSLPEAIQKIEETELNVLLCDHNLSDWKKLSMNFKRKNRNKIFLLIVDGKAGAGESYDSKEVDALFCFQSFKEVPEKICDIIGQMVSRRYLGSRIIC